jgi:transcriptional regulator GlxA family with amidase domain
MEDSARLSALVQTTRPPLSVAFVLLPDFTVSTFSAFVDALRIAADESDGSRQLHCRWTIIGPECQPVRSSCGVEIAPWETFGDPTRFDYTIVVGGLLRGQKRIDRRILSYLRQVDALGGSLVGACTGSFALARAGLMKNHRTCVHWCHLHEFAAEFPDHRVQADVVYRVDGKRITCAGGQSAIDVAVSLVERHCGRNIALKVTSAMIVAAARGPRDPQPHAEAEWFRAIKSSLVKRAILLMEQEPAGKTNAVRDIASQLGVSVRTLMRGFKNAFALTPAEFLRALRLSRGRWEVLNTQQAIGGIALDHGFCDASHFIRLFRSYYGVSPAAARQLSELRMAASIQKARRRIAKANALLAEMLFADVLFSLSAVDWPT